MNSEAARNKPNDEAIATELLSALGTRQQITPLTQRFTGFELKDGYRVARIIRGLRHQRGERPIGRKIGLTNPSAWAEYGIHGPIWGDMYDSTIHMIEPSGGVFRLARMIEPRIEPEIALGLIRVPEAGMDDAALVSCVEWIAHGFEIVQSVFQDWRFGAVDAVAAFGLHGAYLMGPRYSLQGGQATKLAEHLTTFEIAIECNGTVVDTGNGRNVLGGPLSALRHFISLLADDPGNPTLTAGEIVTTGALTRAFPIAPGETWRTEIRGLPLDGLAVRFA